MLLNNLVIIVIYYALYKIDCKKNLLNYILFDHKANRSKCSLNTGN